MEKYATLVVDSKLLALGSRVRTFEWSGPSHAPVLIRAGHLRDLNVNCPHWPDSLEVGGYPLKLIPGSQHDSSLFVYDGALYARVDGLNWLSWLRWALYRNARALAVKTYYRIIITLHVWGLASYEPNRRPSWRDIGKR